MDRDSPGNTGKVRYMVWELGDIREELVVAVSTRNILTRGTAYQGLLPTSLATTTMDSKVRKMTSSAASGLCLVRRQRDLCGSKVTLTVN